MDYTEGLLLGKLWSDTDFENRRHAGLFILYGILADIIAIATFFLGFDIAGLGSVETYEIVLLVILSLACPFICFRYYRFPLWGKLLVLAEKFYKAFLVLDLGVKFLISRINVGTDGLKDYLVNYLNGTLEKYTSRFASSAGSFSTVMGVLAGGVHVVLVVVLIAVAAIVIPGLIFLVFRAVQFAYDWVIEKLIIKRFFRYRK